ncbi:MAG: molybdopterin-dependent oxidoreductase, partial [Veillonella sp.]|nr:molybdopterin-dependent oxidoreductase [Veillonella sp.]
YGSESVLRYSYAGTMGRINTAAGDYFFRRIKATDQDRGICSPAKGAGYSAVMGKTLTTKPQEAQDSDCIVLWGINAAATDMHFLFDVAKAKEKGAQVWVIDTHKTYTAPAGQEHLQVLPGSDGALGLALMHIWHRDQLVDQAFIDQYVQGWDQMVETLPAYTPAWAAEKTGLTVEAIEGFAKALAAAKAPYIRMGSGLTRYGNGAMTSRIITCLPALLGAYQHPGGGILTSAKGSAFLTKDVMENGTSEGSESRLMPMIRLGHMLTEEKDIPIHMIYIFSSNPAITAPDQNKVRQGLMRDDLFTIVHERFFTDTCKYADIILPATSSVEHDDIYNSYGHYTIGTGYKAVDPIGQSRSNWQVISDIARRMGLEDDFFKKTEKELIEAIVADAKVDDAVKERILAEEQVEIDLPAGYKMDFKTPSGKIEIFNPRHQYPLPCYLEPYGDDAEFWLINGNDIRILDSSFCEREFTDKDLMHGRMHPSDAARKGLVDGQTVLLSNERGQVRIPIYIDEAVTPGTIVSLGVWWQRYSSDPDVGVNALTAQRPTDDGWGSTFYDVKVNVEIL